MKKFQELPKTIQKTVRYIYQDAPLEKLEDIQKVIERAIQTRRQEKVQ
ncbi:hypothetical protein ACQCVP_19310 [Rossellomorea vietnamensis]|nr:hypothetical protein [Rossellomorea aquimaris]